MARLESNGVRRVVTFACGVGVVIASAAFSAGPLELRPAMDTYRAKWDLIDQIIREKRRSGARQVAMPAVSNWAGLEGVGPDPSFCVNSCASG